MTAKLVETHAIEVSGVPLDVTGAGHTGDWFNLKFYGKITFLLAQGAWAGGTPAVTLQQATSAAGANAKALGMTKYWSKVAITGTVFAETAIVSDTFNLTATANSMTVVEVNAEQLDVDNGFNYVQINVASPGANADLLAVIAILSDPRYAGAPATQLPNPKV